MKSTPAPRSTARRSPTPSRPRPPRSSRRPGVNFMKQFRPAFTDKT
jgi:hypothetical protein